VPPGQIKNGATPAPGSHTSSAPETLAITPRALGSWIDDASVMSPRATWMTVSTNQWKSPVGTGHDAPIVDLVRGLTPRVQVGVTLPYSRFSDGSGQTWTGLGDVYITAKVLLRSPDATRMGISVSPSMEWATGASAVTPGSDRVHWVFPVNFELRRTAWRAYGSGGYFTRGAVFAAAALEKTLTPRVLATGTLTQSFSTSAASAADAYGLSRRRTDAGGGVAVTVSPTLMLFGSISRTLSQLEFDSSRVAVNAGVSVNLGQR
jgi:hypothetical protein